MKEMKKSFPCNAGFKDTLIIHSKSYFGQATDFILSLCKIHIIGEPKASILLNQNVLVSKFKL